MSEKRSQLLQGQTLKEMAEHACTLSALDEGRFHRWEFGKNQGMVYATETYCVFFNAKEEAFTGSFSVFADREYKRKFMEVATLLYKRRFSMEHLFEMMDNLNMVSPQVKLDVQELIDYETSFNAHIATTGGVL